MSDFIRDKLKAGFVGRFDLLSEINSFMTRPPQSAHGGGGERTLLITSEPGIGKSTVMCRIIHPILDGAVFAHDLVLYLNRDKSIVRIIESYLSSNWLVSAIRQRMIGHHICMASNAVTLSPIRFVRSLALQFCSAVKGFTERLIDSPQTVSVLTDRLAEDGSAQWIGRSLLVAQIMHRFRFRAVCTD